MIKLSSPFALLLPLSLSSTKVWTISVKRGKYITPPGALALLADIWFCVKIWEHKIVNILCCVYPRTRFVCAVMFWNYLLYCMVGEIYVLV